MTFFQSWKCLSTKVRYISMPKILFLVLTWRTEVSVATLTGIEHDGDPAVSVSSYFYFSLCLKHLFVLCSFTNARRIFLFVHSFYRLSSLFLLSLWQIRLKSLLFLLAGLLPTVIHTSFGVGTALYSTAPVSLAESYGRFCFLWFYQNFLCH